LHEVKEIISNMNMNSSISDTIPLYLADKLLLDEAIQLGTYTPVLPVSQYMEAN
jgi:hypothetical protein